MTSIAALLVAATTTLTSLANDVKDDGAVDSDEVNSLRNEIYSDGTVDSEEIAVLWDIADNCTYSADFEQLVRDAVRDWAYADGEVDADEAAVLRALIDADGEYSDLEVAVLRDILLSGADMPDHFRSWAESVVVG